MAYTSITEEVEGRIARKTMRLMTGRDDLLRILPAVERALAQAGMRYRSSPLADDAHQCMSIYDREGVTYRVAIAGPPSWEPQTKPPRIILDAMWAGNRKDAADTCTSVFRVIEVTPKTSEQDLNGFFSAPEQASATNGNAS